MLQAVGETSAAAILFGSGRAERRKFCQLAPQSSSIIISLFNSPYFDGLLYIQPSQFAVSEERHCIYTLMHWMAAVLYLFLPILNMCLRGSHCVLGYM